MQNQTIQPAITPTTIKHLGTTSLVKTASQKVINDTVVYNNATPVTNCGNGFSGVPTFPPATMSVAVQTAAKLYGQMMQMQALATNTDTQFLQQSTQYTVASCSSNRSLTKKEVANIIHTAITSLTVGIVLKTAQVTFTALSSSSNLKGTAAKTKYDTVKFDLDRQKVPEEVLNEIKNTPLSKEEEKEIRKSLADHLTEKSTGVEKLTALETQYDKDTAQINSKMENGIPLTADEKKSYKELKTKYGADRLAIEKENAAKKEAFDKLVAANPAGYAQVAGLVKEEHDQAVKNLLKEKSALAGKPFHVEFFNQNTVFNDDHLKLLDKPFTVVAKPMYNPWGDTNTTIDEGDVHLMYKDKDGNSQSYKMTIPADKDGKYTFSEAKIADYLTGKDASVKLPAELVEMKGKLNEDITKANEELTKHTTLSDTTNEEYSKKYLTNLQEEEAKFMKTGMLHGVGREISDALNSFTQQGVNAWKESVNNTMQTAKSNVQASNQTNLQISGNEEQSAQGQVQSAGNLSQLMSQLLEMIF
jgi:hypothetical protein